MNNAGKKNMKLNDIYDHTDEWKYNRVMINDKRLPSSTPPIISASIYWSLLSTTMTATSPIVFDSAIRVVSLILSFSSLLKNLFARVIIIYQSPEAPPPPNPPPPPPPKPPKSLPPLLNPLPPP